MRIMHEAEYMMYGVCGRSLTTMNHQFQFLYSHILNIEASITISSTGDIENSEWPKENLGSAFSYIFNALSIITHFDLPLQRKLLAIEKA